MQGWAGIRGIISAEPTQQAAQLLDGGRGRHLRERAHLSTSKPNNPYSLSLFVPKKTTPCCDPLFRRPERSRQARWLPKEVSLGSANPSFGRRELEVVLAEEVADEFDHVEDVGNWVFIEGNNIIPVRFDAFRTMHHCVNHVVNAPSRAGVGALRHAQEFEQLGRGAECSQRSGVGVRHNVVEGRVQVGDGENLALVERIQDAIHPRQRLSVHFHKRVEALTIDGDAHSTIFLRNNHKRTSPRGT